MADTRFPPHRILIVNAHSTLNCGDSAIALGTIEALTHWFPSAEMVATSRTPGLDRLFYGRLGVRVIPPVFHSPAGFAGTWQGRAATAASVLLPWNAARFLFEAARAEMILVAGGGYFYSPARRFPGPTFWQNFLHVRIPLWLGKPVVFLAQSFGPFEDALTFRYLLPLLTHRHTRTVFVRDTMSRDTLQTLCADSRIRLALCPDLALYHQPGRSGSDTPQIPPMPRPRVAVALRDWDFLMADSTARTRLRERYLSTLLDTCARFFGTHHGSFVFFSQARGPSPAEDDRIVTRQFVQRLREAVPPPRIHAIDFPPDIHPDAVVSVLSGCDILISSRLHAVILSCLAGTPAIALGYLPKSRGIMRGMGMERFCLEIDDASVDGILARMEELLSQRNAWAERIRSRCLAMRSDVDLAMQALIKDMPARTT